MQIHVNDIIDLNVSEETTRMSTLYRVHLTLRQPSEFLMQARYPHTSRELTINGAAEVEQFRTTILAHYPGPWLIHTVNHFTNSEQQSHAIEVVIQAELPLTFEARVFEASIDPTLRSERLEPTPADLMNSISDADIDGVAATQTSVIHAATSASAAFAQAAEGLRGMAPEDIKASVPDKAVSDKMFDALHAWGKRNASSKPEGLPLPWTVDGETQVATFHYDVEAQEIEVYTIDQHVTIPLSVLTQCLISPSTIKGLEKPLPIPVKRKRRLIED